MERTSRALRDVARGDELREVGRGRRRRRSPSPAPARARRAGGPGTAERRRRSSGSSRHFRASRARAQNSPRQPAVSAQMNRRERQGRRVRLAMVRIWRRSLGGCHLAVLALSCSDRGPAARARGSAGRGGARTSPSSFWPATVSTSVSSCDASRPAPPRSPSGTAAARAAPGCARSRGRAARSPASPAPSPRMVCSILRIARDARSSSKSALGPETDAPASSARATGGGWASAAARPRRRVRLPPTISVEIRPSKRQSTRPAAPRSGRRSA